MNKTITIIRRRIKNSRIIFLPLLLICSLSSHLYAFDQTLTILHTNDWQSRLLGFGPNADYSPSTINDDTTRGGISRLASLIEQRRKFLGEENVMLLDGGDYSMGTLFNTIIRETGSELQLLSALGYDAITLGNHEFDYNPEGLASSIRAAMRTSTLPPIVISNMVFSQTDPRDDTLEALWHEGIIKPYIILNRGGKKVGIFGLMGSDAIDVVSNGKPVTFSDPIEAAKKMVNTLTNENVDLIVVLSHGGVIKDETADLKWKGDDVELLSTVEGIDVVIGGHSHTPLVQPIVIDNRLIVQAGSEAQYLGELALSFTQSENFKTTYQLHPIDDSIKGSDEIVIKTDQFKQLITEQFLKPSGYSFDQVLGKSYRHLSRVSTDNVIANLVTDSLRISTESDISITSNGVIRDEIYLGSNGFQGVSDLFRLVPIGLGLTSNEPGQEILKVWITGQELKQIIEVMMLANQTRGPSFYPRFSGFQVTYNSARIPLDRITQIKLGNEKDGYLELELSANNEQLYSLAINTYIGSLIGLIDKISKGLFEIKAKNEAGQYQGLLIDNVYDSSSDEGVQPIKEWQAFFQLIENLPDLDEDGIADIPSTAEPRLIEITSYTPANLFKNASWIMYAASFLLIALTYLFGRIAYRIVKRQRS